MRAGSFLPGRTSRRLDRRMSDLRIARARRGFDEPRGDSYSADDIANELVPRRDHLVDQVPRELAAARGLSRDQWEIAVDEAIDYLVTEFDKPLYDSENLERLFWKVVSLRIKRVHEGRGATVRAGWRRVDVDVTELPTVDTDPERTAIEHDERVTLLEFRATLTDSERQVLDCQYAGRRRKNGRVVIARELGIGIGEVRKHERDIIRKLERFAAIIAAGSLCKHREPQLLALHSGNLTPESERVALLHLAHCPACRVEHVARLRSIRSGELPREIANLLPAPIVADQSSRRGTWDAVTDWASRPWTHDATQTSAQLGLGRGLGTIAATKLVALCIGGVSVVGGGVYCVTSPFLDHGPRTTAPDKEPRAQAPARPQRAEPPDLALAKTTTARATPTPTATPKPKRRPKPETPRRRATSKTPTSHEQAGAISPAPSGSAPDGSSEFGPTSANQPATNPAPPVASGGPEFP